MNLNRSFLYGICFSSITWVVSLYLYWQLTSSSSNPQLSSISSEKMFDYRSRNEINNNVLPEEDDEGLNNYKKQKFKSYVNSENLIKQLQPVAIKGRDSPLNELGMVRSLEDRKLKDEGYKIHAFNVLISSQLSFHRVIPDTRNKL